MYVLVGIMFVYLWLGSKRMLDIESLDEKLCITVGLCMYSVYACTYHVTTEVKFTSLLLWPVFIGLLLKQSKALCSVKNVRLYTFCVHGIIV